MTIVIICLTEMYVLVAVKCIFLWTHQIVFRWVSRFWNWTTDFLKEIVLRVSLKNASMFASMWAKSGKIVKVGLENWLKRVIELNKVRKSVGFIENSICSKTIEQIICYFQKMWIKMRPFTTLPHRCEVSMAVRVQMEIFHILFPFESHLSFQCWYAVCEHWWQALPPLLKSYIC